MNWKRMMLSGALLLSLVAAPRAFGQATMETAVGPVNPGPGMIMPLSNQDMYFLRDAAGGNAAELQAAQLAMVRGTTDAVRAFAQQMLVDHSAAGARLASLAARKGVYLSSDTDDRHKQSIFRLGNLSGRGFDDAYISSQISDHKQMIAIFQREMDSGRDADLRAWAADMLPHLQAHLAMAQQLRGSHSTSTTVVPGTTVVVPTRTVEIRNHSTNVTTGTPDGLRPNSGANMPTTPPDVNSR